ncbi:Hypothetical predicted protein, partial [Mytilus galloprovincialis]
TVGSGICYSCIRKYPVSQDSKQALITDIGKFNDSSERLFTTETGILNAEESDYLAFTRQLINPPKVYRSRLSMPRVMHFIEFISCPTYHQAVGYGSKTLKLSSGLEITIPKVVRNVIASRLVSSYSQYCNDEGYECLGRSTLFNIVKACAASQKKNMHGLDNITSEGMRAIDILLKIVSKLEMFGLSSECVVKLKSLLDHVNQHLKFEMKGHVENKSKCAEHCSTYSLSDPTSKCFSDKCDHDHDQSCDDCSTTGVLGYSYVGCSIICQKHDSC